MRFLIQFLLYACIVSVNRKSYVYSHDAILFSSRFIRCTLLSCLCLFIFSLVPLPETYCYKLCSYASLTQRQFIFSSVENINGNHVTYIMFISILFGRTVCGKRNCFCIMNFVVFFSICVPSVRLHLQCFFLQFAQTSL